jgi:hypothetical protein
MLRPEWLNAQAQAVGDLRLNMLFDDDQDGAPGEDDPEATEFYLIALAMLDQAHRNLRLAALKQTRMIARAQGGPQ